MALRNTRPDASVGCAARCAAIASITTSSTGITRTKLRLRLRPCDQVALTGSELSVHSDLFAEEVHAVDREAEEFAPPHTGASTDGHERLEMSRHRLSKRQYGLGADRRERPSEDFFGN